MMSTSCKSCSWFRALNSEEKNKENNNFLLKNCSSSWFSLKQTLESSKVYRTNSNGAQTTVARYKFNPRRQHCTMISELKMSFYFPKDKDRFVRNGPLHNHYVW